MLFEWLLSELSMILLINFIVDESKQRKKQSCTTESSTISTEYMNLLLDKLKMFPVLGRKRNVSYHKIWCLLNKFIIRLDTIPETWRERLVLFVAYLVEEGKQSSTVKSYISAIKYILRIDHVELNDKIYKLSALTKACKLVNDAVKTKRPVSKRIVENDHWQN